MPRLAWVLIAVGLLLAPSGRAKPAYDFAQNVLTFPAERHPLWSKMMAQHTLERAALDDCLADRAKCPSYLKGLRRLVKRADGLNPHAQMVLINRFFNKRRYVADAKDPESGAGYWHTPTHFLREGGDCEDYAIAKYFTLRQLGFAKETLRIVVSYDTHARDFHAMLAVNIDGRSHFLENDNTILRGGEQRIYAVSYAINEDYWWDHAIDQVGSRYSKSL